MKSLGIAAVVGCLAFASLAHAQGMQNAQSSRMLADENGDGKVTSAEYQKSRRDFIMSRGDRNKDGKVSQMIDSNKDKSVDAAEINKMTADRFAKLDLNKDGAVDRTEGRRLQQTAQKDARAAAKAK